MGGLITVSESIDLTGTRIPYPTIICSSTDTAATVTRMDSAWLTAPLKLELGISLSDCTFSGTTGLDQIRPTGRPFRKQQSEHAEIVSWQQRLKPAKFFGLVRDGRQRLSQDLPDKQRQKDSMSYADLASLYRQLRIGLEQAGNIPGGHDFYYGEMENRRKAAKNDSQWAEASVKRYN